jgi:hypothetical protein
MRCGIGDVVDAEDNEVILSYRKENFARIKPKNKSDRPEAIDSGKLKADLTRRTW